MSKQHTVKVAKIFAGYQAQFNIGVQTLPVGPITKTRKEAQWWADMADVALSIAAEKIHEEGYKAGYNDACGRLTSESSEFGCIGDRG